MVHLWEEKSRLHGVEVGKFESKCIACQPGWWVCKHKPLNQIEMLLRTALPEWPRYGYIAYVANDPLV